MENDRNLKALLPPPRKLPLSLSLHLLLSKFISGIILVFAIVILPVLIGLWSRGERSIMFFGFGIFAVIIVVYLLVSEFISGNRSIRQFKEGILVFARLVNVNIEMYERNDRTRATRVLTFEYAYRGKTYNYEHRQVQTVSQNSKLLEDDEMEPFLIIPEIPEKPLPMDSFQAGIFVNNDGELELRKPSLGYMHLILTLLGAAGVILEIYFFLVVGR